MPLGSTAMSRMTSIWRISNYEDLQGIGGLTKQGRWHTKGKPVVYLAEHPALAMLEVMVHLEVDIEDIPDSFKLLNVNVPSMGEVCMTLSADLLPEGWRDNSSITQNIGNQWLLKGEAALLKVPSAVMPHAHNYLLNPLALASKDITIIDVISFPFDERLLKADFE